MAKKILKKHLYRDGYQTFKTCNISENGKEITFQYGNGVTYDVPLEYYLQWHKEPHYVVQDGQLKDWPEGRAHKKHKKNMKFAKCRRVRKGLCVRVYLSDSTACDIPWDTVLMACEKNYEEFGGWTEESKKVVFGWHKKKKKMG